MVVNMNAIKQKKEFFLFYFRSNDAVSFHRKTLIFPEFLFCRSKFARTKKSGMLQHRRTHLLNISARSIRRKLRFILLSLSALTSRCSCVSLQFITSRYSLPIACNQARSRSILAELCEEYLKLFKATFDITIVQERRLVSPLTKF